MLVSLVGADLGDAVAPVPFATCLLLTPLALGALCLGPAGPDAPPERPAGPSVDA